MLTIDSLDMVAVHDELTLCSQTMGSPSSLTGMSIFDQCITCMCSRTLRLDGLADIDL